MIRVWRLLPKKFVERPFDVYSAFAVFSMSLFSIFRGDFPESLGTGIPPLLWYIIDTYLIIASLIVLTAIFCNNKSHPQYSYLGQMWGWAFIASASISLMTYLFYNAFITNNITTSPIYWIVGFVYGCVGWAAFFKSINMWVDLQEASKNGK